MKVLEQTQQETINPRVQIELNEWAKLTEKYQEALGQMAMKCKFCLVDLDEVNVNTNCEVNVASSLKSMQLEGIPKQILGTQRHYFV